LPSVTSRTLHALVVGMVAVVFAQPQDLLGTPDRSYSEHNQSSELQDDQWRELA